MELGKRLTGQSALDDWIRFFNIKTEEDLKMLKTVNTGVEAAIRELQLISMNNPLRIRYEAHMKRIRDERAREAYVREEGMEKGLEKGVNIGYEQRNREIVLRKYGQGVSVQEIAQFLEIPIEKVEEMIRGGTEKSKKREL